MCLLINNVSDSVAEKKYLGQTTVFPMVVLSVKYARVKCNIVTWIMTRTLL